MRELALFLGGEVKRAVDYLNEKLETTPGDMTPMEYKFLEDADALRDEILKRRRPEFVHAHSWFCRVQLTKPKAATDARPVDEKQHTGSLLAKLMMAADTANKMTPHTHFVSFNRGVTRKLTDAQIAAIRAKGGEPVDEVEREAFNKGHIVEHIPVTILGNPSTKTSTKNFLIPGGTICTVTASVRVIPYTPLTNGGVIMLRPNHIDVYGRKQWFSTGTSYDISSLPFVPITGIQKAIVPALTFEGPTDGELDTMMDKLEQVD